MTNSVEVNRQPGTVVPWDEILKKMEPIQGDADLIKSQWEKLDAFVYLYLWWWVQR